MKYCSLLNLNKIKTRWEDKPGMDLTEELWTKALKRVHSSSSCTRLEVIQLNVLHGVHLSKARLAEIHPGTDASCDRCSFSPADLTHSFLPSAWQLVGAGLENHQWGSWGDIKSLPAYSCIWYSRWKFGFKWKSVWHNCLYILQLLACRRILLVWKSVTPWSCAARQEDVMFFL